MTPGLPLLDVRCTPSRAYFIIMIPKLHCISLCAPLSFFPILGSVVSTNAHIWSCHSFVILCYSSTHNRILVWGLYSPSFTLPRTSTRRFVSSFFVLHSCLPLFHLFLLVSLSRLPSSPFPWLCKFLRVAASLLV